MVRRPTLITKSMNVFLLSENKILMIICIVIISSIFLSCSMNTNMMGNWRDKKNWVELYLNTDSMYTFHFDDYNSRFHYYSKGKWSTSNKKLIINSSIKSNVVPFEISYSKLKDNDARICISIILNLFNEDQVWNISENDYVCEPFTNDTIPLRSQITWDEITKSIETNSDLYSGRRGCYSICLDTLINDISFEIRRTFYTSTYFIEQPIKTETKKIDCSPGDSITVNIRVDDDLFNHMVFANEELKIKNRKIIFIDANENKLKEFTLKKRKE